MSKISDSKAPVDPLVEPEQELEHLNFIQLNANRAAVLKYTDEVIGGNTSESTPLSEEKFQKDRRDIKDWVRTGAWSKALAKLDEVKDNKIGIVWHESPELKDDKGQAINGTRALVRDARNATLDKKKLKEEAGEKYAMQILNEVRQSLALVDQANLPEAKKEEARARLQFIAQNAVTDIDSLNSKTVKRFNTQIVFSLKDAGIKNAAKKLVFAKEIGNFHDEHRHIVTLTRVQDNDGKLHTATQADIMLNGLSDAQKEEYQKIAAPQRPTGVEWFDKMELYKQDLVRGVADKIISGKKVIPTQFLKDLPGLKNAYQKVTAIRAPDAEKSEILLETLHSGTPATQIKVFKEKKRGALSQAVGHLKKNDAAVSVTEDAKKQAIVDENIEQLLTFIAKNDSINLNILNGKAPGGRKVGENFIFDQIYKAKDNNKRITVTSSSINNLRWIGGGGRDTKKYQEILGRIADGLSTGDSPVLSAGAVKYFEEGGSKDDVNKDIDKQRENNPELASALDAMVRCRELSDSSALGADLAQVSVDSKLKADSGNVSLEMTSGMNRIINSARLESGALRKALKVALSVSKILDFCKSGKDRTGLVKSTESNDVINDHLGVKKNTKIWRYNLLAQEAGMHTQQMAGVQGGSIGCFGIKLSYITHLPKALMIIHGIIDQKSAGFNSKIKVLEGSAAKKAIAKFEQDFANENKKEQGLSESTPRVAQQSDLASEQATRAGLVSQASEPIAQGADNIDSLNKQIQESTQLHNAAFAKFTESLKEHKNDRERMQAAVNEYKQQLAEFQIKVAEFKEQYEAFKTLRGAVVQRDEGRVVDKNDPFKTLGNAIVQREGQRAMSANEAMKGFGNAIAQGQTNQLTGEGAKQVLRDQVKLSKNTESTPKSTPNQRKDEGLGRAQ